VDEKSKLVKTLDNSSISVAIGILSWNNKDNTMNEKSKLVTVLDNLSTNDSVAIIILNWNGKQNTHECLESVLKLDYSNYQVIIADNGSEDDSVQFFKQNFPDILIIENGSNLGYAEGNNRAITYAIEKEFEYILLLNNDAIVDAQLLKSFIDVSKTNPQAGVFGAKIYYLKEPRKIWFAGGKILPGILLASHEGGGEIDNCESWEEVRPIDYACGCALFIKSNVIRKIGVLESKFFLMWEETDFCYRARRGGFECLFVPKALVWHKISASFKDGDVGLLHNYFMIRNRLLWIERNVSMREKFMFLIKVLLPDISRYLRGYLSPRADLKRRTISKVRLTAVMDYTFRRFGNCPDWIRSL
jgi:GT2 family glycosyltransferase